MPSLSALIIGFLCGSVMVYLFCLLFLRQTEQILNRTLENQRELTQLLAQYNEQMAKFANSYSQLSVQLTQLLAVQPTDRSQVSDFSDLIGGQIDAPVSS